MTPYLGLFFIFFLTVGSPIGSAGRSAIAVPFGAFVFTLVPAQKQNTGVYAVFQSGQRDSNPRHSAWEADALPTELRPQ